VRCPGNVSGRLWPCVGLRGGSEYKGSGRTKNTSHRCNTNSLHFRRKQSVGCATCAAHGDKERREPLSARVACQWLGKCVSILSNKSQGLPQIALPDSVIRGLRAGFGCSQRKVCIFGTASLASNCISSAFRASFQKVQKKRTKNIKHGQVQRTA